MGKSIGIDLGTTNSVVAFKDATVRVIATGRDNEDLCRSCVAVDRNGGSFIVGNAAYKNWRRYAPNIVVSVKRLMGASISDPQVQRMKQDKEMYPYGISRMSGGTDESVVVVLNGKEYTPEQISAEILRSLKNDASVKLGDEVTHAVITVPAYFNEKQKTATRKAAELAGLKVQRLLAEPTAAAISYGADKLAADEDKIFLVYDFGGGTFDLSILVASGGNFIESGTGGDRWLGGDDIDRLVSEYVLSEAGKANNADLHQIIDSLSPKDKYRFQGDFKNEIESAKKTLSQNDSVSIEIYDELEDDDGNPIDIEVTLTRSRFEEMIRPLVQRTIGLIDELLKKTGYPIDTIDSILQRSSPRRSLCWQLLRERLSCPIPWVRRSSANCGKTVEAGASECPFCHHPLEFTQQVPVEEGGVQVSITTKHKVFIQLSDDAGNTEYRQIIDENEPLPFEANHKFYTLVENQKIVGVKLFSDAENNQMDKLSTGYFTIQENLPVHSELQFTFSLTEDEVMNVRVRVPATGKTTNVVLGRGELDAHCLESIGPAFDRVMNDNSISESKKSDFVDELQKIIDDISTNHYDSRSARWQEEENALKSASQAALAEDDYSQARLKMARILISEFGQFISADDRDEISRQADRLQHASSPAEKKAAMDGLTSLVEKYGLFIHGFLLNIAGHSSDDPARANQAVAAYRQFKSALEEGNIARARDILDSNEHLIAGLSLPSSAVTTEISG